LNGGPSLTSRKDEAEAERFLNKVDDVTGLLQMLLSKDQSEVATQIKKVFRGPIRREGSKKLQSRKETFV
jgi:hypothetical protein